MSGSGGGGCCDGGKKRDSSDHSQPQPNSPLNVNLQKGKDEKFKVVLAGDLGVGKTSLLYAANNEQFYEGIRVNPDANKLIKTPIPDAKGGNAILSIELWDTGGQEKFRTITAHYYHGCRGVILCFDLTSRDSFERLGKWIQEIERFINNDSNADLILVGTKADLPDRKVSRAEAEEFSKNKFSFYGEVSSKNGAGVSAVIQEAAKLIYKSL